MTPFIPYEPRPLRYLGLRETRGYRLKTYAIVYGTGVMRADAFEPGLRLAEASLPEPAVGDGRPGVGFAILHQGRTGDYVILGWWDRENELPLRIVLTDGGEWRHAAGGESMCVWDLRVIWWEREAYVATMLSEDGRGVEAYLAAVVAGYA